MRNLEEEPHGGSMLWLMAMFIVVLSTKVDTITADIVMLAIACYTMRARSTSRK